jgi:hypothetical protein
MLTVTSQFENINMLFTLLSVTHARIFLKILVDKISRQKLEALSNGELLSF